MIVIIDGRSGAGKTTFAAALARALSAQVIHLDDFYPGWSGLAAASAMVAADVFHPVRPGYWRWDWDNDRRGHWHSVDFSGGDHLIVEGCGALSNESLAGARLWARRLCPQSTGQAVVSLYVDADPEFRKTRALARDPFFEPYWQMWARQEEEHARHMPPADFVVDGALLDDVTTAALIRHIIRYGGRERGVCSGEYQPEMKAVAGKETGMDGDL